MIFQPLLPWWGLLLLFAPFIALITWQLVKNHTKNTIAAPLRYAAIVILAFIIALQPAIPGASRNTGVSLLDVYFVVDTSPSAVANDYNGSKTRLSGMQQDIKDISNELIGARFSLITFDNRTRSLLPLTTDTTALTSAVDTIIPQTSLYSSGSSIDLPLDTLTKELQRIKTASPERARVVLYMGDGEQTAASTPRSFAALKALENGGAVLGYGTSSGGTMSETFVDGGDSYPIMDHTDGSYSTKAVSKIDETALQKIATDAGLTYIHRQEPGNIDTIVKDIDIGKITKDTHNTDLYESLYWIFAPFIAALLLYDTWSLYTAARAARGAHATQKQRRHL